MADKVRAPIPRCRYPRSDSVAVAARKAIYLPSAKRQLSQQHSDAQEDLYLLPGRCVPKPSRIVYAGREHIFAIGGISARTHNRMTREDMEGLAAWQHPTDAGSLIGAARRDNVFAIWREGPPSTPAVCPEKTCTVSPLATSHRRAVLSVLPVSRYLPSGENTTSLNLISVPGKDANGFASGDIPKSGGLIAAASRQILAVWREGHAPYITRVTLNSSGGDLERGQAR